MTKDEFIYWTGWLKIRWPNAQLGEYTVKSLYKDFEIFDDNVFGKVLLDYFDIIVHVFDKKEREYYSVENIWADVPRQEFNDETI